MKILIFSLLFSICLATQAKKPDVLLITGGHGYDTLQFFNMFDGFKEISYRQVQQPEANRLIGTGEAARYDLLVFYDMVQTISDGEKEGYIALTKIGKPFLFLHHSICSYQNWPEFEKILGGKYVQKGEGIPDDQLSTYRHDVLVDCEVVGPKHPVTRGFMQFTLTDEVYGNFRVGRLSLPLLKTGHPESSPVIAWENKYNQSTIVYLQPGHDKKSFENQDYRKLVRQAIMYLIRK